MWHSIILQKKIIYLQSGVDAFVNRRRRTISESTTPDRITVINGYNNRLPQPSSAVMNSKCINGDSKKLV